MLAHERYVPPGPSGTDDAVAINAAAKDLYDTVGGGVVFLDAKTYNILTSVTRLPNVIIKGAFRGASLFAGSNVTKGTVLKWGASNAGSVIYDAPPAGATQWMENGGFSNLTVDGNGIAANGIAGFSTIGATYERLHVMNCVGNGIYLGVAQMPNVAPNYHTKVSACNVVCTNGANGMVFDGLAGVPGGNTCFARVDNCHVTHKDGTAFAITAGDDNVFTGCGVSRIGGGQGASVYFGGAPDTNNGRAAFGNTFVGFNANSPIVAGGGGMPSRGNLMIMTAVDNFPGLYQSPGATITLIVMDGEIPSMKGFTRGIPAAG